MSGAAYDCTVTCTDDESYLLTLTMLKADGSPFEVAEYAFEYSMQGCGADLLLTEGEGITIDNPSATATITPGLDYRLQRGTYNHGFRKRNLSTDQVDQIFDGTVTVTEGNF